MPKRKSSRRTTSRYAKTGTSARRGSYGRRSAPRRSARRVSARRPAAARQITLVIQQPGLVPSNPLADPLMAAQKPTPGPKKAKF